MPPPVSVALVVAKAAPLLGTVTTRLFSLRLTPEDAGRLADAFLGDTLDLAGCMALRARLFLALDGSLPNIPPAVSVPFTTFPQTGNSREERLVDIFARTFEAGASAVCVIGSDTPHLPAAFVIEAFGRLAEGADMVLGPADDGGCYLIGLPRPTPELFADIPWGTERIVETTIQRAVSLGLDPVLLPRWYDVVTPDDLARLRTDLWRNTVSAPATQKILHLMET